LQCTAFYAPASGCLDYTVNKAGGEVAETVRRSTFSKAADTFFLNNVTIILGAIIWRWMSERLWDYT
jgi:hypothetical protein